MPTSHYFLVFLSLFISLLAISSASPVAAPISSPGPDQALTIWPAATLATMKAQRQALWEYALAIYEHRGYFDDPVNCVVPPIHDPRYAIGASCPRANLVSWSSGFLVVEQGV